MSVPFCRFLLYIVKSSGASSSTSLNVGMTFGAIGETVVGGGGGAAGLIGA